MIGPNRTGGIHHNGEAQCKYMFTKMDTLQFLTLMKDMECPKQRFCTLESAPGYWGAMKLAPLVLHLNSTTLFLGCVNKVYPPQLPPALATPERPGVGVPRLELKPKLGSK